MAKITHEGTLKIGEIEMPCYVAEDGKRLLAGRQFQVAMGIVDANKKQVAGKTRLDRFWVQLDRISEKMGDNLLIDKESNRAWYEPSVYYHGNRKINGYDARLLHRTCQLMLKARREGLLTGERQLKIADQCEILQGGFAEVGIIALIDEATGYQKDRKRGELADILKKWIEQETHRAWTKTFPLEFYDLMFKLKGWSTLNPELERPSVVGKYTNDLIYERLAPALLQELQKKNPITLSGYRKHKHHQWLTGDVGHPRLKEHLIAVMALMRAASTWEGFKRSLQRAFPKLHSNLEFSLETDD